MGTNKEVLLAPCPPRQMPMALGQGHQESQGLSFPTPNQVLQGQEDQASVLEENQVFPPSQSPSPLQMGVGIPSQEEQGTLLPPASLDGSPEAQRLATNQKKLLQAVW